MTQISKRLAGKSARKRCCHRLDAVIEPRFFKALCDPNRIAILVRLAGLGEPCTVTQAAECCPVNISVVSRHLATLRDAGILDARKRGKEVFYSVPYAKLAAALRAIADAIEACCSSSEPASPGGGNNERQ